MRIRFGWSILLSVLLFGAVVKMSAEEKKVIRLPHVDRPPRIEDFLGGKPQGAGLEITDFRQRKPRDGAPASHATTA